MTILLFCLKIEMLFSSHVTLGNYSLTIEFYWSTNSANLDVENRVFTQRFVRVNTSKRGHARWIFWVWRWVGGGVGCDVKVHCDCNRAVHSLAPPHIRHATLLHVLLHFHTYVMLWARTACGASKQQVPEKRLKWQNFAHNRYGSLWSTWEEAHEKEFLFGQNTDFRRTLGLVKNMIPQQLNTHQDCRQDFRKKIDVLVCCRASKAMSWTTSDNFVLERKKGTFRRNPRRTKLLLRACKTLDFPLLKWPFHGICARNLFQKYKHV